MQRVTPRDRDRAVRRLTTATGAITAGSIALTGAFMSLAKHDTDAQAALKAQQKAAALAAQQFALTDTQPVTADGSSPSDGPSLESYPSSTTSSTTTSAKKKTTTTSKKKTSTSKKAGTSTGTKIVAPSTSTNTPTPTKTYTPPPPPPPSPSKTKQPPVQSSGS